MTIDNTLFDRCTVEFLEAVESMDLSVHVLARLLKMEAADELIDCVDDDDEEPEDDWKSHPSLTAEQRNPNLK